MAWTLAEGLVDEIVVFMNTNIGAKLDAIDTEIADSIVLADPEIIERSEKRLDGIEKFPIMIIMVDDTTIPEWTGVEVWGFHSLVMGMIVSDDDPTDLKRRLYRYGRAIFELIGDAHNDGGVNFELGVGESTIDFSPLFSTPESRYIGDVTVSVPAVLKETR